MDIKKRNELHPVPALALADPQIIAQALLYEATHGNDETFKTLALLLECNRNEKGQNISAVVTTALLPVNRQPYYLFNEGEFARSVLSHLSRSQLDKLQRHNAARLQNPEPDADTVLIREVFGTPAILKEGEGNSLLAHFLRSGHAFANPVDLEIPPFMPTIDIVKGSTMAHCMLSMCLDLGYPPLMRHDGSHVITGHPATTAIGEIHNQTYDLTANALAQYGVVPTFADQMLNRKVTFSFQELPDLQRSWEDCSREALETWRAFFVENPEYAEKWTLRSFLDADMRMVKPDGSPIISTRTGEQQIPVIDYTDLSVLRYLKPELDRIFTDGEVHTLLPYEVLYKHMLQAVELVSIDHILRDGAPPVLVSGIYDACATHRSVHYNEIPSSPNLGHLTSPEPGRAFTAEDIAMGAKRAKAKNDGLWCGYLVDLGQDQDRKIWVHEKPPSLVFVNPEAVTVYRVALPMENIESAISAGCFFGGTSWLTDGRGMQIDSVLSLRNEQNIPTIARRETNQFDHPMGERGPARPFHTAGPSSGLPCQCD